jgi:oligopeptide transport system ATP-binding protein
MHPYTRSLISAIPIPDPRLEKHKVLFTYDPSIHDYSEDKPELVDIGHNHFVYGNKRELEEYRRVRESGVAMKSVTISGSDKSDEKSGEKYDSAGAEILERKLHDTGSKWYSFLSFLCPPLGLLGGFLFRRFKHYRNYKACKRGAIIGFSVLGGIVALFGLLLLYAGIG